MSIRTPSTDDKKQLQGLLCYHNTTETPLANTKIYVGHAEETLGFTSATVSLRASHSGTLTIEQSMDGSSWDFSDLHTFTAGTPFFVNVECKARYLHIIITNNSGSNYTYLRAQTILKNTPKHVVEGDGVTKAYRVLSLSTTGQVANASKCRLESIIASNSSNADSFLKVYNKSTAPTEADTPVLTIRIPTLETVTINLKKHLPFLSGLSLRASSGIADNDTGSSSGVSVNVLYSL